MPGGVKITPFGIGDIVSEHIHTHQVLGREGDVAHVRRLCEIADRLPVELLGSETARQVN